jgi:group I intron endonuclease
MTKNFMNCGVYKITAPSGNCYIGSSRDIKARWHTHKHQLKNGKHRSIIMQRAWDKYGAENFKFEILLVCEKENLLVYEQLLLDALNPKYNICRIAGNSLGVKASEETKKKIGAKIKGRPVSESTREKLRLAHTGKKLSDETKHKLSLAKLGIKRGPHSAETRRRISLGQIGNIRGPKTEDAKNRIRQKMLGIKRSPETIEKMKAAQKRRWLNESFASGIT